MPWWKEAPCHQYFELPLCLASRRCLEAQRHAFLLPRGQSIWDGGWDPSQVSPQHGSLRTEFSPRGCTVLEYPLGSAGVKGVCTCLENSFCAPCVFYHSWVPLPSTLSSSDFSTSGALLSCPSNVHQLILIVLVHWWKTEDTCREVLHQKWNTGMKMQQLVIWGRIPADSCYNHRDGPAFSLTHAKWVVRTLPSLEQISHLKRQKVLQGRATATYQGKIQRRPLWYTVF